jgi:hypothetical protein
MGEACLRILVRAGSIRGEVVSAVEERSLARKRA